MRFWLTSLTLLATAACGEASAGRDAPTAHFRTREASAAATQPQAGDLALTLSNAIPRVEVPAPHLPTTVHVNAKLCSRSVRQAPTPQREGNDRHDIPLEGSARCLALAPTLYHGTEVTYVVTAAQLAHLRNGDYQELEVVLASSSQTTVYDFPCRPAATVQHIFRDRVNELRLTVRGQHSLAFDCR